MLPWLLLLGGWEAALNASVNVFPDRTGRGGGKLFSSWRERKGQAFFLLPPPTLVSGDRRPRRRRRRRLGGW